MIYLKKHFEIKASLHVYFSYQVYDDKAHLITNLLSWQIFNIFKVTFKIFLELQFIYKVCGGETEASLHVYFSYQVYDDKAHFITNLLSWQIFNIFKVTFKIFLESQFKCRVCGDETVKRIVFFLFYQPL